MSEMSLSAESAPKRTLRRLGPLEEWFYLLNRHRPNHFSVVAETVGALTAQDCSRALKALQSRHPFLNASIEQVAGIGPILMSSDDGSIPLRTRARVANAWTKELEREAATALSNEAARLMRVVLLEGQGQSDIIFTIHHSIADGMALLFAIRDFFEILSGRGLAPLNAPPSVEDRRRRLQRDRPIAPAAGGAAPESTPSRIEYRPETASVKVDRLWICPDRTDAIRRKARAKGVTMHAALTAALVLAGRSSSPDWSEKPVRVFTPMNLRASLAVEDDMVPILGAAAVGFAPVRNVGLWDLADEAMRGVNSFRTPESEFYLGGLLGALTRDPETLVDNVARHFAYELMLTNPGNITFGLDSERLQVTRLWGPLVSMGFAHEQVVSALTYKGALHLMHNSPNPLTGLLPRAACLLMDEGG
jgi:hypothetical protein